MNKSFTIIELMVAVFVLLVGILAAFSLVSSALSYSSAYKLQLTAAYLAQEGIEIVRNIRDTNWTEGASSWNDGLLGCQPPTGCEADYESTGLVLYAGNHLKIGNGFYNYNSGTETPFKRKITIDPVAGEDALTITVDVAWSERGRDHTFETQEKIYNWR